MANPPEDFKCPISLEIMSDPVILSTGQTYDRSSIQRWLEAGERTCPKTKIPLQDTKLIPNYALRSLICQWAQSHGVDLKKPAERKTPGLNSGYGPAEREGLLKLKQMVEGLIKRMSLPNISVQGRRDAIKEIRVLAKENRETRLRIVECGAIAKILGLLSCGDAQTEENSVVALLNLSVDDENKVGLVAEGAVDYIVNALKNASMDTRATAAVTLTSLAVVDVNKATIGSRSDAIPALVKLLAEGNARGKKEATTTLYSLCFYPDNKRKAVISGAVPLLLRLAVEGSSEAAERPLEVLDMLSFCPEGRDAIGQQRAIMRTLLRFVNGGTLRSREHAVATLSSLCCGSKHWTQEARDAGAMDCCLELLEDGTARSRRKASALIKALEECQN
eukprot:Gb_10627 [translate_table: standard]